MAPDKLGLGILTFVPETMRRSVLHMNLGGGLRLANADIAECLGQLPDFGRRAVLGALSVPRRQAVTARLEISDQAAQQAHTLGQERDDPPGRLRSAAEDRLLAALEKAVRDGVLVLPEALADPDELPLWPESVPDTPHLHLVHDRNHGGVPPTPPPRLHLFRDRLDTILRQWLDLADLVRRGQPGFDTFLSGHDTDDYSRTLVGLADDEVSDAALCDVAADLRQGILAPSRAWADMVTATVLAVAGDEPFPTLHARLGSLLPERSNWDPNSVEDCVAEIGDCPSSLLGMIDPERLGLEIRDRAISLMWLHRQAATKGRLAVEGLAETMAGGLLRWGLGLLRYDLEPHLLDRALADRSRMLHDDLDRRMQLVETLVIAARNRLPRDVVAALARAVVGDELDEDWA